MVVRDLSGDGKPDIAVANVTSNNVSVFINKGNGTFGVAANYDTPMGPNSIAAGEVSGDGKPDWS